MAISLVNIGTTPNDGTGDSLRASFTKVNDSLVFLDSQISAIGTVNTDYTDTKILEATTALEAADTAIVSDVQKLQSGLVDNTSLRGFGFYAHSLPDFETVEGDVWFPVVVNGLGAGSTTSFLNPVIPILWEPAYNKIILSSVPLGTLVTVSLQFTLSTLSANAELRARLRVPSSMNLQYNKYTKYTSMVSGAEDSISFTFPVLSEEERISGAFLEVYSADSIRIMFRAKHLLIETR